MPPHSQSGLDPLSRRAALLPTALMSLWPLAPARTSIVNFESNRPYPALSHLRVPGQAGAKDDVTVARGATHMAAGTDFVLDALIRDEGLDHLFMVPGGLVDPFLPALARHPGLKPIVAAHEGGAAY